MKTLAWESYGWSSVHICRVHAYLCTWLGLNPVSALHAWSARNFVICFFFRLNHSRIRPLRGHGSGLN